MNNWNIIQNELLSLKSRLPSQKIGEAYNVPEGYFDQFASTLLRRLQQDNISVREELANLSPILSRISKNMPYSVPDDYFQQTTKGLKAFEDDEKLPQILLDAGRFMPYNVPAGYFEELPNTLSKKIKENEGARVVSMFPGKWLRIAAAAIVAGIITLSSIFYFSNKPENIEDESWVASSLKNVSNKDLEEFINVTDLSTTAFAKNEKNFKSEIGILLNDVPDKELEKFLNDILTDTENLY